MMIGGGGGGVSKKHFLAPRASVWSKNKGGGEKAPGPLPRILHCCPNDMHFCLGN